MLSRIFLALAGSCAALGGCAALSDVRATAHPRSGTVELRIATKTPSGSATIEDTYVSAMVGATTEVLGAGALCPGQETLPMRDFADATCSVSIRFKQLSPEVADVEFVMKGAQSDEAQPAVRTVPAHLALDKQSGDVVTVAPYSISATYLPPLEQPVSTPKPEELRILQNPFPLF